MGRSDNSPPASRVIASTLVFSGVAYWTLYGVLHREPETTHLKGAMIASVPATFISALVAGNTGSNETGSEKALLGTLGGSIAGGMSALIIYELFEDEDPETEQPNLSVFSSMVFNSVQATVTGVLVSR